MSIEVYGMTPARRRVRTPCQQQQSAPHAALLMIGTNDPYWSQVVQLNHYAGTDGSQTFTNSASAGNTPTATGTNASLVTISTARALFASQSSSLRIGATSGQGWTHNAAISPEYAFGTADFTIEYGFWPDTLATQNCYDMRGNNATIKCVTMYTYNTGKLAVYVNGVEIMASATGIVAAGAWNRIAYTRAGTTGNLYVGGTRVATATDNTNYVTGAIDLPTWTNNSAAYRSCNYAEHRVTNGTARYTGASYTLATAPFPNG